MSHDAEIVHKLNRMSKKEFARQVVTDPESLRNSEGQIVWTRDVAFDQVEYELEKEGIPFTLPDGLTIHGYAFLEGTSLTELPRKMVVTGDLYLELSGVRKLPSDLVVRGTLNVTESCIEYGSIRELRKACPGVTGIVYIDELTGVGYIDDDPEMMGFEACEAEYEDYLSKDLT